jgi:N-acetylneuraminate lyase
MASRTRTVPPTRAAAKLDGLIAAPFTPFDKRGDLNLPVIRKQVDHLVKSGVRGAYVSGTTGEGISCTVAERKAVMEEWIRAGKGRLRLIVHVGALSIRDTQDLAAHAQKSGADAISIVPPNYFKPASIDGLITHIDAVVSAAPRLPFYYYHTTQSGVDLPMVTFLEVAEGRLPSLAGIKFNDPDLYVYQNCLRACGGRFDIVWGVDEFFAGAIALGARAFIGSTYNYAASLYPPIRQAIEAGRLADAQSGMAQVCRIVDLLMRYGGIACGKAMMAIHGIDVGDPRLPLKALTLGEKSEVVTRLRSILA